MPMQRGDNDQIVQSSENIFGDLGLELTAEDEIKLEIAREITRVITARKLTQIEVARRLATSQARVSEITRGRLSGFSAERLFRFLLALGVNIDVYLSDADESRATKSGEGRVQFHTPAAACG